MERECDEQQVTPERRVGQELDRAVAVTMCVVLKSDRSLGRLLLLVTEEVVGNGAAGRGVVLVRFGQGIARA